MVGVGFDLDDIFDADVLGGWGVFSRQGGHQYLCEANLHIDNNAEVTDVGVYLQIGTSGNLKTFSMDAGSLFQLGDAATMGGGSLILWHSTSSYGNVWGTINLYGVVLEIKEGYYYWKIYGALNWEELVLKCIHSSPWISNKVASTMKRCSLSIEPLGFMIYTGLLSLEDITLKSSGIWGIFGNISSGNVNIRDIIIQNSILYHFRIDLNAANMIYMIVDSDYNIYKIWSTQSSTGRLRDYKTFDLQVETEAGVAIQGATVTITDAFGTDIVETTDINGDITAQELYSFQCINNGNGSGVGVLNNTYTFHTPYTINITKAGYWEQEYVLDLLRDDHKRGVNYTVSLIPLSDFIAIPIDVSVGNPDIVVTVEEPTIVVEVDCG